MESDRATRIKSGSSTFKAPKEKFVQMSDYDKKKLEEALTKEEDEAQKTTEEKQFISMCEDNKSIISEILDN
jgi:hypothetical protein